jgi:hypothetical protein
MPSTGERENAVPQRHVSFKIFCIFNYTSLFHNTQYLSKNLILVKIITNEVEFFSLKNLRFF